MPGVNAYCRDFVFGHCRSTFWAREVWQALVFSVDERGSDHFQDRSDCELVLLAILFTNLPQRQRKPKEFILQWQQVSDGP